MSGLMYPVRRAAAAVVSTFSDAGVSCAIVGEGSGAGLPARASGAVTANVLKTALSITGRGGNLLAAAVTSADGTSRTHRLVVTLDDVVVFDTTSAAAASTGAGISVALGNNGGKWAPAWLPFNRSCKIEFTSSLTETNKQNLYYAYIAE